MIGWAFVVAWLGFVGPDDARVRAVLADDAYAFCHDPTYPLTDGEAAWCPILAVHGSPMCPAFPQTCDAARAEIDGAPGRMSTRRPRTDSRSDSRSDSDSDSVSEPASASESESESELPPLGGIALVLFWAVIGVGVVALVAAIAANSVGRARRRGDEAIAGVAEAGVAPVGTAPSSGLPTDIETLLVAAEAAERRGDLVLAVDFGHAALLRRLDHEGVVRLHRSHTTGDYVADLRAHPDWRGRAAPVLRDIDRAQFRATGPDAPLTRSILARVVAIARAAASTVAIVLVVSFVLACSGFGATPQPWSASPSGSDALIELWRDEGRTVRWRTNEVLELEDGGTIVLLDGARPQPPEWDAIETWVRHRGGVLVVADAGPWPPWIGAQPHGNPYAPPAAPADALVPGDARLVFADDDELEPAFSDIERDYAAQRRYGSGRIVALADDHLLTNAALAVGLTEGLDVVGGYGPIDLVDSWTGEGASSPMESIEHSHLTAAMAQLFVLVLALLLWRGWPFGRGRDPAPAPMRGFTDHARAMGLQYASARASGHAAAAYAGWALEALRRDGALHSGGLHGLAQAVARRTGRDETDVMRILVEAHGIAESGASEHDAVNDMKLLRELLQLVREGGGRR